jgi:tetratricopeptide (TPR) repeat protein
MKEDAANPSLKSVVALLKLCDWDPDVFYKFRDVILNQVCQANIKLRNDLCRGIPRVWENYYQLDKEKDVAFEIGRFFYGIRDFGKALRYYTISSETIGEHHVTFHNMGLCFYSLNMTADAIEHFQKSIKLNSKYVKAQTWLEKVQKEIKAKESGAEGGGGEENVRGTPAV